MPPKKKILPFDEIEITLSVLAQRKWALEETIKKLEAHIQKSRRLFRTPDAFVKDVKMQQYAKRLRRSKEELQDTYTNLNDALQQDFKLRQAKDTQKINMMKKVFNEVMEEEGVDIEEFKQNQQESLIHEGRLEEMAEMRQQAAAEKGASDTDIVSELESMWVHTESLTIPAATHSQSFSSFPVMASAYAEPTAYGTMPSAISLRGPTREGVYLT